MRRKYGSMLEIQEILIDERAIENKVRQLAAEIARDYAGKDPIFVCILKGAVIFTADLMRLIPYPVTVDFVHASSYGLSTESARQIRIKKDMELDITDRHVLLVDTIIDTGETLACLFRRFAEKRPASIKAVVLIDKVSRRTVQVPIAYRGFEIPDKFVVGYGVDCKEQYRNLPHVAVVKT